MIFLPLVASLLAARVTGSAGLQCTSQLNTCSCMTEEGVIDLSPLDTQQIDQPRFHDIPDAIGDRYAYNPCTGFTAHGCTNVAICQNEPSGQYTYTLGAPSSALFGVDATYGDITLTYQAADFDNIERTSIISLKCDPNANGTLIMDGEYPLATYHFTLTSMYACPQSQTTARPNTTTARPSTTTTSAPIMPWNPTARIIGRVVVMLAIVTLLIVTFYTCVITTRNNTMLKTILVRASLKQDNQYSRCEEGNMQKNNIMKY